jgi:septal ring factor EnvC (AmiA/AmiB activator)
MTIKEIRVWYETETGDKAEGENYKMWLEVSFTRYLDDRYQEFRELEIKHKTDIESKESKIRELETKLMYLERDVRDFEQQISALKNVIAQSGNIELREDLGVAKINENG